MNDIIFANRGHTACFDIALEILSKTNPDINIHIISDTKPVFRTDKMNISRIDCSSPVDNVFVNYSPNSSDFELACIARWFWINDYVFKAGLKEFIVADWDIMFFCDLAKEFNRFRKCDFTVGNKISAGLSFWYDNSDLDGMTEIMLDFYKNVSDESNPVVRFCFNHLNVLKSGGILGGICDMTFFDYAISSGTYIAIDTYDVLDGKCFDNNMNDTKIWKEHKGFKDVFFEKGKAYCLTKDGEKVEMCCLHCTAGAKPYSEVIKKMFFRSVVK